MAQQRSYTAELKAVLHANLTATLSTECVMQSVQEKAEDASGCSATKALAVADPGFLEGGAAGMLTRPKASEPRPRPRMRK